MPKICEGNCSAAAVPLRHSSGVVFWFLTSGSRLLPEFCRNLPEVSGFLVLDFGWISKIRARTRTRTLRPNSGSGSGDDPISGKHCTKPELDP